MEQQKIVISASHWASLAFKKPPISQSTLPSHVCHVPITFQIPIEKYLHVSRVHSINYQITISHIIIYSYLFLEIGCIKIGVYWEYTRIFINMSIYYCCKYNINNQYIKLLKSVKYLFIDFFLKKLEIFIDIYILNSRYAQLLFKVLCVFLLSSKFISTTINKPF